jgi:5-(aminomethyl)-3-furanmethanol phosphate kinase
MWVVKIGGSLQDSACLVEWLDKLLEYGSGKVVIVAGGGKFADAVLQSQLSIGFDDRCAHKMALLAMEQSARLLVALAPKLQLVDNIKSIQTCLAKDIVPVWLPYKMVVREPEIPASWDVTSDSLAAWLAIQLQISSLILVKSVSLPSHYSACEELAERGLVDPFLPRLLMKSVLDISWLEKGEVALLPSFFHDMRQIRDHRLNKSPIVRTARSQLAEVHTKSP